MAAAPTRDRKYGACTKCGRSVFHRNRRLCRHCYVTESLRNKSTPLRRWRARTGKSFRWLAKEIGADYRTITRIANGGKTSRAMQYAIHALTGIPLSELRKNV
jgi:hypothetical protein